MFWVKNQNCCFWTKKCYEAEEEIIARKKIAHNWKYSVNQKQYSLLKIFFKRSFQLLFKMLIRIMIIFWIAIKNFFREKNSIAGCILFESHCSMISINIFLRCLFYSTFLSIFKTLHTPFSIAYILLNTFLFSKKTENK